MIIEDRYFYYEISDGFIRQLFQGKKITHQLFFPEKKKVMKHAFQISVRSWQHNFFFKTGKKIIFLHGVIILVSQYFEGDHKGN